MPADVAHACREAAISGAIRRLQQLGWSAADMERDADAISAAISAAARDALPAAVADYQDARACGMEDVARLTFSASLTLAGIRAADRHHAATRGEPTLASWEPTLAALAE